MSQITPETALKMLEALRDGPGVVWISQLRGAAAARRDYSEADKYDPKIREWLDGVVAAIALAEQEMETDR